MTREEEIRLTADKYCRDEYTRLGFVAGAEWADAHPQWISVEDEMPSFIDIVLYCDEDGNYYTEADNIVEDVKITHWMHIPDCPPLQEFNNKLRAVLDGENEKGAEQ